MKYKKKVGLSGRCGWILIACQGCVWLLTFDIAGASAQRASAQRASLPEAQIVLFTPSDVKPPSRKVYAPRLHQFGLYAEKLFHDGLTYWGHSPERKQIFNRDRGGRISVVHVQGDLPAANRAYKSKRVSAQVLDKLRSQHRFKTAGNLFWIFVYVGDPPAKHEGYRGAGNSKDGGWAVLNYTNLPGRITLGKDAAANFHNKLFLKGCIHEFGHALGLPHIGPKVELRRGNSLMGPVTRIYVNRRMPNNTKVYLSEASAAILSAHPVFTGTANGRNKLPQTAFQQIRVNYDRKSHAIKVTGQLQANHAVAHVVMIDDRDDKIGGYWVKGFVAELDQRSRFVMSIPQPNRSGKLKLLAVYENGAFTGDGKKRGIDSARIVPYSFR